MRAAMSLAVVAFAGAAGFVVFLLLALVGDLTPAPGFMTAREGASVVLCVAITLGVAACLYAGRCGRCGR